MALSASLTILIHEWVTGGGLGALEPPASWVAEGQAMRRAVAADFASLGNRGIRVLVTLDERAPEDPGPWSVVRIGPGEWPDAVCELARRADYTVLIAPETMGILAGMARGLQNDGAQSLGSTAEAIELTGDKLRFSRWLKTRGVRTPHCLRIIPKDGLPAEVHFPAVFKPIDGAGSLDTYYLSGRQTLPRAARRLPEALLQPFRAGVPLSGSFLVREGPEPWLVGLGWQRIEIRNGRFTYHGGRIPWRGRFFEPQLARALASVPGLRGFVGIDFVWEAGSEDIEVLEINPRPTTSYVGLSRILPPGHLAAAWLASFGAPGYPRELLEDLADLVDRHPGVSFDAEGNTWPFGEGRW
jgi:predicted ATP-grasp superfamily ATP-dependent carboligase